MTEPHGPIHAARQQQTEREQQPARKLLDQMNDHELAALYGERDLAVSLLARVRKTSARLINEANARTDKAEAKAAAMTAAMESTAADALRHRGCHRELMGQCLRAERAEAALARVRTLVHELCHEPHPSHDHVCPDDVRRRILAALHEPKEPRT